MGTTTIQPITLTAGAMKQLKRIMEEQNVSEEYGLRVGVKGGGCSGFSYILGFDVKKENDEQYDIDGMKVFMEKLKRLFILLYFNIFCDNCFWCIY